MGLYLKFPNKEISTSFTTSLVTRYMDKGNNLDYMVFRANDAINRGDTEGFITILKEYYESFPSAAVPCVLHRIRDGCSS